MNKCYSLQGKVQQIQVVIFIANGLTVEYHNINIHMHLNYSSTSVVEIFPLSTITCDSIIKSILLPLHTLHGSIYMMMIYSMLTEYVIHIEIGYTNKRLIQYSSDDSQFSWLT